MTLNDLRDEVAALAFEDGILLNKSFIASANRALITLFTERPVAKTARLATKEQEPLHYVPLMTHTSQNISVRVNGRAYVFRVSGKGSFTVTDGKTTVTKSFDGADTLFRGIVKSAGATITFGGEFAYNIYSFATYKHLYSENEADVREYKPYSEYDIDALFGDFLAFLEAPAANGGAVTDAVMQNGVLILPYGKYDEVWLTYARMPKRVNADGANEKIDVPSECEPLLALLTAAYLWLDDDAEKAQYYMSLYRTEMSFIRRYNTSMLSNGYQDVTGWA